IKGRPGEGAGRGDEAEGSARTEGVGPVPAHEIERRTLKGQKRAAYSLMSPSGRATEVAGPTANANASASKKESISPFLRSRRIEIETSSATVRIAAMVGR